MAVRALWSAIAVLVLAGFAGALDEGFLRPAPPPAGALRTVDAVVVLGGDHGDRLDAALDLRAAGAGRTLVVLTPGDGTVLGQRLCATVSTVTCLDAGSTRDEAAVIADVVRRRGWRSIAVVTSAFHVRRAGLLFDACTDARVVMVPSTPPFTRGQWARSVAREAGGVARLLVAGRADHCRQ